MLIPITIRSRCIKKMRENLFHYLKDTFCYTSMPFGLKNAKLFINIWSIKCSNTNWLKFEAYVDDMMIKSVQFVNHVKGLKKIV